MGKFLLKSRRSAKSLDSNRLCKWTFSTFPRFKYTTIDMCTYKYSWCIWFKNRLFWKLAKKWLLFRFIWGNLVDSGKKHLATLFSAHRPQVYKYLVGNCHKFCQIGPKEIFYNSTDFVMSDRKEVAKAQVEKTIFYKNSCWLVHFLSKSLVTSIGL
jgi:hypothetical protein